MADMTDAFRELAWLSKHAALAEDVAAQVEGTVVSTAGEGSVVLDQDLAEGVQEVAANFAGPVQVGDRVLLLRQRRRLTIVANPSGAARLGEDTGWVTGVVSPTAGVSVDSSRFRRIGPWVTCDVGLVTTVAYSSGPSGDISNSIYNAQVTDARFRPSGGPEALASHGSTGRIVAAAIETGGRILIGAIGPSTNVNVGDRLRIGGTYLAG